MQLPLQITFRHMSASPAMEENVLNHANKLERFHSNIMSCRVVVEAPHKHRNKGNLYRVRVDVTLPGGELVASRTPEQHHSHTDAYVAIRDAFDQMTRQLEAWSKKQQREVKQHAPPPHGRVTEVYPEEGYGRIDGADGEDVYFHRNSVVNAHLEKLQPGDEVRFSVSEGEQGPQATSVTVLGKHRLLD